MAPLPAVPQGQQTGPSLKGPKIRVPNYHTTRVGVAQGSLSLEWLSDYTLHSTWEHSKRGSLMSVCTRLPSR